jgi:hypothetical protein
MRHIRPRVIAACMCVACLFLTPRAAMACSCVDWGRLGVAQARKAFLDEWTRAQAAVSGTVVAASDLQTVVSVRRTLKGQAPEVLRIFPRPVQPTYQRQGDQFVIEGGFDCRPSLNLQTEYLILLFRKGNGAVDAERCAVWTGVEREQRLRWIPKSRKRRPAA